GPERVPRAIQHSLPDTQGDTIEEEQPGAELVVAFGRGEQPPIEPLSPEVGDLVGYPAPVGARLIGPRAHQSVGRQARELAVDVAGADRRSRQRAVLADQLVSVPWLAISQKPEDQVPQHPSSSFPQRNEFPHTVASRKRSREKARTQRAAQCRALSGDRCSPLPPSPRGGR